MPAPGNTVNLPLPYGRSLYFCVTTAADDFAPDLQRVREEIHRVFRADLMEVCACWTESAIDDIIIEFGSDSVERGLLAVGHTKTSGRAVNREKQICDGRYRASLIQVSVGVDLDPVPSNRPKVEGSIEERAGKAFEAQLATTIDTFVRVFEVGPKEAGPAVRMAISPFVHKALNLNEVGGDEFDRQQRASEQIRRWAGRGRKYLSSLFTSTANLAIPVKRSRHQFNNTLERIQESGGSLDVLVNEPNATIQKELAILFALAEIREVSRTVHAGHLEICSDASVLKTKGVDPNSIVNSIRNPRSAVNKIVEEPARRTEILDDYAETIFPLDEYGKSYSLLLLVVEIALRYEIDVLELFPSLAIWRSFTQAARAVSAYNRNSSLPEKTTIAGVCAYWGLRSLIEDDPRCSEQREPLRQMFGCIPSALRDYALSERPPNLGIEHTERFGN
ncbi:MAG TPA: hypothetical protein ENH55_19790 [Aurantimonas coralicida]|uniref:Uncharacterized protein n=2 Tax=root TaxID=1 RepID=A0A9C9TFN4_9HYPH|nr:hypothetical protein [Aurantimonas coralicida]HET99504.1 hypothetical protein [Aurantimonas coralicida]